MKETIGVRLPAQAYQRVRKEAFRRHVPMTVILEEAIGDYFAALSAKE